MLIVLLYDLYLHVRLVRWRQYALDTQLRPARAGPGAPTNLGTGKATLKTVEITMKKEKKEKRC